MTESGGPLPDKTEKALEGIGVGVVAVLVVIGVCAVITIIALALLGPAIGNVFSNVIIDSNF